MPGQTFPHRAPVGTCTPPGGHVSMGAMAGAVRYCGSAAGRIAYRCTGAGPALLVDPGWVTHLKAMSSIAGFHEIVEALGRHFMVIRFDKPGCGLSDREAVDLSFDGQVAAALAVADAANADRFSVFGASQGGQVAVALAARHPARIRSLVLYGTCADGRELATAPVRASLLDLVSAHWGLGSRVLADIFLSDVTGADIDAFARLQRACASPQVARSLLELYYATDVGPLLDQVRARTAVLHREGDTAVPFALGRDLASRIEGATLTPLPGAGHLFYQGPWQPVLDAALAFLTAEDPREPRLTDREIQVSRLVADGLTTREIAARLGVAARTADTHVQNIRHKLKVRSRAQIAAWSTRQDAGPPD